MCVMWCCISCRNNTEVLSDKDEDGTTTEHVALEPGGEWELIKRNDTSFDIANIYGTNYGGQPRLVIDLVENRIGGFTGCNAFGTTFHIEENRLIINDTIEANQQGCKGTWESDFFNELRSDPFFELVDGNLKLTAANSNTMTFKRLATKNPAGSIQHEYAYLLDETQHLVEFLRKEKPLNTILLADTVTLYIAPEGGGQQRKVPRRQLDERSAWQLGNYSLIPPDGMKELTISPGLHYNCQPQLLSDKFPELGDQPHVGVRLALSEDAGCLQTWNLTFVFDDNTIEPELTAVVYDQWEW